MLRFARMTASPAFGARHGLALSIALSACQLVRPASVSAGDLAAWLTGPREEGQLDAASMDKRLEAAHTLGRWGEPHRAVAALAAALGSERQPEVRRALMRSLARRGDAAGVPALIEALSSRDGRDVVPAAEALGAIGSDAAIHALIEGLEVGRTATAAGQGLARIGVRAAPPLIQALHEPAARLDAARVLGSLGEREATPALVELLHDQRSEVRQAAVVALRRIDDARAAPAVAAMLSDPFSPIVVSALGTLARIGGPAQREAVRRWVTQGPPAVRRAALGALLAIAPEKGAQELARILGAGDQGLSPWAAQLALECTHPAVVPVLYGLLKEGTLADAAASALAEVDDGRGVSVLLAEASPDKPHARAALRAAAVAVRRWPGLPELARQRVWSLLEHLTGSRDVPRTLLLRALARDPWVAPWLRKALGSSRAGRRAIGALGLEVLGDRSQGAFVVKALGSEQDPEAFRRMASAALALGAPAPFAVIEPRFDDPSVASEAMALAAGSAPEMSQRQRTELGEALRRALRATDGRTRAGASRGLAILGARAAWRAIATRLEDGLPEVRRAAARALAVLAVPASAAVLEAQARVEDDASVRLALSDAAAVAEGQRRRPLAFDEAGDEVLRVRVAALAQGRREGVPVDVVLPDGRWLTLTTLPGGELLLPDLPAGRADVRVRMVR